MKSILPLVLSGATLFGCTEPQYLNIHELCASENATYRRVSRFLEKGVDIDEKNNDGKTALHLACGTSKAAVVSLLIEAGSSVRLRDDKYERTALHWAALQTKDPDVLSVLLDQGAKLNTKDKNGATPLELAATRFKPNKRVVAYLLKCGADIPGDGDSVLCKAATRGNTELLSVLLDCGAELEPVSKNYRIESAIWCAIRNGADTESISTLISSGADPTEGISAAALYASDPDIVETLVKAGGKFEKRNSRWSPLHNAAGTNSVEMVEAFMRLGSDATEVGIYGGTVLHHAAGNNVGVTSLFIESGADVNARNDSGRTPLHKAVNGDIVRCLVQAGAAVDAQDDDGDTPLREAAYWKNSSVVRTLLQLGADPNTKFHDGSTPLHSAAKTMGVFSKKDTREYARVVMILLDANADANAKDEDGMTAFNYAIDNEYLKGTEALRRLDKATNK